MIFQAFLQDKKPHIKLLYFLLIVLCCVFLINSFGLVLGMTFFGKSFMDSLSTLNDYSDPGVITRLKYLQVVNQLALFVVPVLIFAMFAGKSIPDYLKLNRKINVLPILVAISIIIAGLPFINWLAEINGNMSFPEQFSGIEKWMRDSEAEAGTLTRVFLNSTIIGGLLINILMIAILPAIGEEFFFSGVLQRLFSEWFKNVHVAIIVTAFIFSAFHMQFFGFIPRFLLGMFLGYLFYWSGSLWLPIIIHFLNNGMAVVVAFLAARGAISMSFETFGSSDNWYVNISSAIVVAGLMLILYKTRRVNSVG